MNKIVLESQHMYNTACSDFKTHRWDIETIGHRYNFGYMRSRSPNLFPSFGMIFFVPKIP